MEDIKMSSEDMDLFARLVHAEAEGEPYIGQVAVAASVLNRVRDSRFPGNVRDVIMQVWEGYYQYAPVLNGRINRPAGDSARRAVRDALSGLDPTDGATGFYNPARTDDEWVREQEITRVIGDHVFYRQKKD